jgi:hypothetical protein
MSSSGATRHPSPVSGKPARNGGRRRILAYRAGGWSFSEMDGSSVPSGFAVENTSAAHFLRKPDEQFLHVIPRGRAAQCTCTETVSILLIAPASERDREIERIGLDVLSTGSCNSDCALVRISSHHAENKGCPQPSGTSSGTLSVEIPTNTTQNATETEGICPHVATS